jgi:CRISPR-associated protein Cmr4
MFKEATIIFLYAETSVHLGGGESIGAIDLAIQRERYTDFPVGAASGIKGAVRAWFESYNPPNGQPEDKDQKIKKITITFGPDTNTDHAGAASFTDAKILLFPVKSMKGIFAWVTCPMVLERLKRDLAVAGIPVPWQTPKPTEGQVIGGPTSSVKTSDNKVVLEEYVFDFIDQPNNSSITEWIKTKAIPSSEEYKFWQERIETQLLVIPDDDFKDFVKNSTEVQSRVKLGEGKSSDTKRGGNLFYQENLPSDSILYASILTQDALTDRRNGEWGTASEIITFLKTMQSHRLQIGGNESIGKGIMYINFLNTNNGQEASHEHKTNP